jgi:hypothetical protein
MSEVLNENYVPEEVSEAAQMATELFKRMNAPEETPPEEPVQETVPEEAPSEAPVDDTWEKKYSILQGKYNAEVPRLAQELREMKQYLSGLQAATPTQPEATPQKTSPYEDVVNKLKEEYPEELIENLLLLNRLQSEQVVNERVAPIQDKAQSVEDIQYQTAQNNYVNYLSAKAPNFNEIWQVANEIELGQEPSNPKIAEFLMKPDPSGLYTNIELLNAYNDKWDADRFATVCNMYGEAPIETHTPARNPSREALVAPSRSNSQPAPRTEEKKIWSMQDINQFQSDRRMEKYTDDQADAIWKDIQQALAENRIR